MIKTKIIATIGPSFNQVEDIKTMIDNGVDVFRLNFSHGTLDEHSEFLEALNTARAQHHHGDVATGDALERAAEARHLKAPDHA